MQISYQANLRDHFNLLLRATISHLYCEVKARICDRTSQTSTEQSSCSVAARSIEKYESVLSHPHNAIRV
ncbi:MAG: hypothetical protein KME55_32415 [Nostoc indistinguendum CM1-VF10]|nr:hypothetical protein [Nostoc indistinguendum CM1-VF10]